MMATAPPTAAAATATQALDMSSSLSRRQAYGARPPRSSTRSLTFLLQPKLEGVLLASSPVWTFDHVATIIGILAAAAGAYFAYKAWRSSVSAANQAALQRSADLRPRPVIDVRNSRPDGWDWSI